MMQGLRGKVCAGCWYWPQLITTFPPKIDYSLTVSVWLPTIWATKKMSSPLPLPKDPQDLWQEEKNFKPHGMTLAQILLSHAWVLFMIYCEWRLVLTQLQALLVQNIIPNSIKYRNTKQREKLLVFVISTSSYYSTSSYQGPPYLISTCCNFVALL